MKGYTTPEINKLIEVRAKRLSQIEVFNMELAEINKKLASELIKVFGGKTIVFDYGNEISYASTDGKMYMEIPSETLFQVIEIRSANTMTDILYFLKSEDGHDITIRQDEMHSFKFVEI